MSRLKAFVVDVSFKVGIIAIVKDGVIFTFTINLNDEFERIEFFWKLTLFMSKAEFLSPNSANL